MLYIFKIICFLSMSTAIYANVVDERKTDIYFGNGVWNDEDQAEKGRDRLNGIIQRDIINNNPILQAKYGEVKLQYNWGQGYMEDVLETFYQLKEAGQVGYLDFFSTISLLTRGNVTLSAATTAALIAKMPFTAAVEQSNANDMYIKYYLESLQWSHRVLLVSHSQGNMFANRLYDELDPVEYQNYFANVMVAPPAAQVCNTGQVMNLHFYAIPKPHKARE